MRQSDMNTVRGGLISNANLRNHINCQFDLGSGRSISLQRHFGFQQVGLQFQKGKASHSAVTNTLNSVDRSGGVTRRNTANTVPAMPVDSSERGKQVPGQPAHRGAGVAHASHCSLYDVSAAKPEGKHNQNTGWPHREERREPGGKVYKVKRTSARKPPAGPKSINAPWGW